MWYPRADGWHRPSWTWWPSLYGEQKCEMLHRDAQTGACSDAPVVRPRPAGVGFCRCCAAAANEVLDCEPLRARAAGHLRGAGRWLGASERERPPLPRCPGDLCRKRRTTRLSMDDWSSFPPLLGVQGVHAFSPQRRRCSVVDARHTRRSRPRPCRASRGGSVRRVATRLLHVEDQTAHNRRDPGTVPLHRRPDRGPPHATRERERLHGRVGADHSNDQAAKHLSLARGSRYRVRHGRRGGSRRKSCGS